MSLFDTELAPDSINPSEDGLTTPSFRQQLEKSAPPLLSGFDSLIRNKNAQIEEYDFKYNQVRADLARQRSTLEANDSSQPSSTTRGKRSSTSAAVSESTGNTEHSHVSHVTRPRSQVSIHRVPTTTRAQHRIPLTDSTRSSAPHSKASFTKPSGGVKLSEMILDMKVKLRLIPVVKLLTGNDMTPAMRAQAKSLAHSALDFANRNNASHALMARCSFYIAHTHYDQADKNTVQDAVNWFQRATEASEGGYPEGQWAQEWLNRYESLKMAENSRPSTAGSWVASKLGGIWNAVWTIEGSAGPAVSASSSPISPKGSKPHPGLMSRHYSVDSAPLAIRRAGGYERIPSFTTYTSSQTWGSVPSTKDTPDIPTRSPQTDWGRDEILQGRRSDLFQSPEPIYEVQDEDETPQDPMPANILGGFVEASALSPAMQRSPTSRSDLYIPQGFGAPPPAVQKWRITNNLSSPPESPSSPGTSTDITAAAAAASQPQSSSYFFSRPPNNTPAHSRAHSTALPTTIPILFSPTHYAISDHGTSSPSALLRNRKRNSISHLIRTTLTGSARPDEAAQMEEGESPFMPRKDERAFYGVAEEDEEGLYEDGEIGETF